MAAVWTAPQTRYAPGPGVKLLYRSRRSASNRSSNPKEKATEVRSTSSTWRPRLDCTVYLRARRMGRGESAAGQCRAGPHSVGAAAHIDGPGESTQRRDFRWAGEMYWVISPPYRFDVPKP